MTKDAAKTPKATDQDVTVTFMLPKGLKRRLRSYLVAEGLTLREFYEGYTLRHFRAMDRKHERDHS
jgi:hypothetical protein